MGELHVVRPSWCCYGRAACCKVQLVLLRERVNSAPLLYQPEPHFERIIMSVRWTNLPNMIEIGSTGAVPLVAENIRFPHSWFFMASSAYHTPVPRGHCVLQRFYSCVYFERYSTRKLEPLVKRPLTSNQHTYMFVSRLCFKDIVILFVKKKKNFAVFT